MTKFRPVNPARQPYRRHARLRPGAHKPQLLDRRHRLRDQFREIRLARRRRTEACPIGRRPLNRFNNMRRGVAQDHRSPGADIIDVTIAVCIREIRAPGPYDHRRIAAHSAEGALPANPPRREEIVLHVAGVYATDLNPCHLHQYRRRSYGAGTSRACKATRCGSALRRTPAASATAPCSGCCAATVPGVSTSWRNSPSWRRPSSPRHGLHAHDRVYLLIHPGTPGRAHPGAQQRHSACCGHAGRRWVLHATLAGALPRKLRDALYELIARNRYRIGGKRTACRVPHRLRTLPLPRSRLFARLTCHSPC